MKRAQYDIIKTDVLVIGSGGAGLRAAIELHDNNADVLVVGKCAQRDAHTVLATGGINAALATMDSKDGWQLHAADTLRDGGEINDARAVEILCKNAPFAVNELARWGADFHREKNGKITQRFFGAATYRRACFVGDQTGRAILHVLVDQVNKRKVPFHSGIYIFSLLHDKKNTVNGAIGLNIKDGGIVVYHAKAVILATGGFSRVFARSSSRNFENNGDGIRLAYDVGASFMDMEMFQFHPTGMVYPKEAEGVLVTEAVRGEGGVLTNARGERFMKRYDAERMELSARDIVARAVYTEVKEGRGTKNGGVWLDISHKPKSYILKRLPKMYSQFKHYAHVDISKQKMEVAPTAHYSMGGIFVDHTTGKTTVPRLYAIGEVTSGVHGANRLGGNSLAEIIVYGRLTGARVAREVKKMQFLSLDQKQIARRIRELPLGVKGSNPITEKKALQQLMWQHVGVVRRGKDMKKAIRMLDRWKKMRFNCGTSLRRNQKLIAALDIKGMIPASEMILRSALFRRESRGAHYRADYRDTLKKWQKNIVCTRTARGIRLALRKVMPVPLLLKQYIKKKQYIHHLE
ncbi:MAG TPA: FAD-dependent oxidoreductase [Candidatus Nanoarchaeia archaeon]|nr:FAD-dependent oxidoreductase [Candidatus Nanoarchaeia archaeon]